MQAVSVRHISSSRTAAVVRQAEEENSACHSVFVFDARLETLIVGNWQLDEWQQEVPT